MRTTVLHPADSGRCPRCDAGRDSPAGDCDACGYNPDPEVDADPPGAEIIELDARRPVPLWIFTEDDRVRDFHVDMNASPFTLQEIEENSPPRDDCRCVLPPRPRRSRLLRLLEMVRACFAAVW